MSRSSETLPNPNRPHGPEVDQPAFHIARMMERFSARLAACTEHLVRRRETEWVCLGYILARFAIPLNSRRCGIAEVHRVYRRLCPLRHASKRSSGQCQASDPTMGLALVSLGTFALEDTQALVVGR